MRNRTNLVLVLVAIICAFGSYGLPVERVEGEGHNDFVFLLPIAEEDNLGGSSPSANQPKFTPQTANGDSTGVRTLESGGVTFKIPSYASGIMDITKPQFDGLPEAEKSNDNSIPLPNLDLLPPVLDDGERNGPNPTSNEIPGSTTQKSVQQFPLSPIAGPTIGNRISVENSFDLPLDLLPPLPSEDKTKNYKPAFPVQSTNSAGFPSKAPVTTSTTTSTAKPSQPEQRFGATFSFSSPTTASSKPSGSSIYTGGFGGAPGILGNQQKPGYAVKPDGSIRDPDQQKKTTTPKPFVPIITTRPPPPVVRPVTPAAAKPVANKYTGSFGGAPGLLSPFDRVVPAGAKKST